MSIVPSDSGGRRDPFAEFDRLSQQIMDGYFSHDPFPFPDHAYFSHDPLSFPDHGYFSLDPFSFPDHGFFPRASPFRPAGFPFSAPAVDRWETSDSHVVRFRLPEGARAGEARAQVDEDGFVTVTVPKREPAPEKRRPNVRVVEIEEKN